MVATPMLMMTMAVLDCAAFPAQEESPYVLPYAPGTTHLVTNTIGHFTPSNQGVGRYAVDFAMPMGTPVHAAREGTVVAVRDSFEDGNGIYLQENFVFVRHEDGTVARYFHLMHEGTRVKNGDEVAQGVLLGLSGNTGQTAGPHLHFDVQRCGPNLPAGLQRAALRPDGAGRLQEYGTATMRAADG